ncbi:unnamed protein product [Clonostachys solani]|uniref:Cuticle-degrading protease n=1 Tax=Clonostachys solani TaxID=160281 RepID=A0A9N9ZNE5_9HYPO|nr:unnamed protein product [Clonostachys solani]
MRLCVLLATVQVVLAIPTLRTEPAPLFLRTEDTDVIADHYIIKFRDTKSRRSINNAINTLQIAPAHTFEHVFKGFASKLSPETLNALRNHPDVEYIEQDSSVSVDGFVDQADAQWGLARISHREPNLSTYTHDSSAGEGTCAYVLDSGIDVAHPDFGGRASWLANFIDSSNRDGKGHGTHVAGIIGSTTYGVAKKTTLYAVKVIGNGGMGTTSSMIAGLEFVLSDAPTRHCPKGVVANMSLRDNPSASLNAAAAALVSNDIFLAVSAGNNNLDTSSQSPASEPTVCTVGATNSTDARWEYSNYGPGVDVFAPGVSVLSTSPGNWTSVKSGTSQASPHVAGLAAYLAALEGNPGADALCNRIKELATDGILSNIPDDTVNKLAFNGNPSG